MTPVVSGGCVAAAAGGGGGWRRRVVVVTVTVVVASEPPRLCGPGEWSDNAATRFTVLSTTPLSFPLFTRRSLARARSRPFSYTHSQLSGLPDSAVRALPLPPSRRDGPLSILPFAK